MSVTTRYVKCVVAAEPSMKLACLTVPVTNVEGQFKGLLLSFLSWSVRPASLSQRASLPVGRVDVSFRHGAVIRSPRSGLGPSARLEPCCTACTSIFPAVPAHIPVYGLLLNDRLLESTLQLLEVLTSSLEFSRSYTYCPC